MVVNVVTTSVVGQPLVHGTVTVVLITDSGPVSVGVIVLFAVLGEVLRLVGRLPDKPSFVEAGIVTVNVIGVLPPG